MKTVSKGSARRKSARLKGFDYRTPGVYFVTICTQNKRCILSKISVGAGLAPPENRLTKYGQIAKEQILLLTARFPSVRVEKFVIMPNHVHLLLQILSCTGGASPTPTLSDVVRVFKSQTTRLCEIGPNLFQRSFHDHIVRNERDGQRIWQYIETNPINWQKDCFYSA